MGLVLSILLAATAPHPAVEAARAEGLPVALLEAKVREAALKQVPPARLDPLLQTMLGHLRVAHAQVSAGASSPGERAQLVSAAASALASGAEPGSVGTLLGVSKDREVRERSMQALTALVSAHVPPERAAQIITRAVQSGLADRLLSVRPALEALRGSGYGEADVLAQLEAAVGSGQNPLDVLRKEERGSASDTRTSASPVVRSPDRDRSDRDEKKAKKNEHVKEEKP